MRNFSAEELSSSAGTVLKPLPREVENLADDPSLHNPLQRMQRLGTGWMGVIMEYDGVVVEETEEVHIQSWHKLAEEEGKPRPMQWILRRAEGMKVEQAIQEVFCWTRNPQEVRRLARRKEELYREVLGERKPVVPAGVDSLLSTLGKNNVPVAVASTAPEVRVKAALEEVGLTSTFGAVVSGEDVYRGRPDPEAYLYAAQLIGRPPLRCVVIGNSNMSVEAAHECGMQCVVVANRQPVYELTAADMVVRQLSELSFVNLKQLFRMETTINPHFELEEELEEEASPTSQVSTMTLDRPW